MKHFHVVPSEMEFYCLHNELLNSRLSSGCLLSITLIQNNKHNCLFKALTCDDTVILITIPDDSSEI